MSSVDVGNPYCRWLYEYVASSQELGNGGTVRLMVQYLIDSDLSVVYHLLYRLCRDRVPSSHSERHALLACHLTLIEP